jgi:Signal transduction histidine kinase
MSNLYWSPLAINALLFTLLGTTIALYFLTRFLVTVARGANGVPMLQPLWVFAPAAIAAGLQTLSLVLSPEDGAFALPWVGPISAASMAALILYSERFDGRGLLSRWGRLLLRALTFAVVGLELAIAVARVEYLRIGEVRYRDAWVDIPFTVGFVFVSLFTFLHLVRALKPAPVAAAFAAILRPHVPLDRNRAAATARGFFYFSLAPILMALVLLARSYGWVGWRVAETSVSWIVLLMFSGFSWVYLNHLPERSGTTTKITGMVLVALLMLVSALSWVVAPAITEGFRDPDALRSGQGIRFVPLAEGGYRVDEAALAWIAPIAPRPAAETEPVDLPFDFPAFEDATSTLYVRDHGTVGLGAFPFQADTQLWYGPTPTIFVLAAELVAVEPGSGVFVDTGPEKAVITWARMQIAGTPDQIYDAQLTLHRNGVVEILHHRVPAHPVPDLYRLDHLPMLTGLSPGSRFGTVEVGSLPGRTLPPGVGAVHDRSLAFRAAMTAAFGPIALFLILAVPALLLLFPALVYLSVSRPISAIAAGVEQFRKGHFREPIPVFAQDELGSLAGAFNEMATERERLLQSLEAEVERRSAEAVELSANNARLREREDLGRDLHDAVSQTLFAASLIADSVPRLLTADAPKARSAIREVALLNRDALAEMRHLLMQLRPTRLLTAPFSTLLEGIAIEMRSRFDLQVEVTIDSEVELPEPVKVAFFRVAHAAITNVARHARTSQASVVFDSVAGQAMLTVRDDGIGFDPQTVPHGHHGLEIMQERLDKIGGLLEVDTAPGKGCMITAIWFSDGSTGHSTGDAG